MNSTGLLVGPSGQPITNARPEVIEFATAMEAKLRKNDHKTSWRDQPIEAHIRFLHNEVAEFETALEFLTFEEACKECVDIANFAMIIRNKLMTQGKAAFRNPPCGGNNQVSPGLDAAIKDELAHPPKSIMSEKQPCNCGVCGTSDPKYWQRCQHPGCHDGRDPGCK